MKNIVKFAVGNPVTICMIVFALLLLGKVSYDQLSVDLLPDLNNPRLFIELKVGERPPEEIEKQFVKNMESMAIRQSDVTQVSSVIKAGTARITVEYTWTKDMDEAFLDLQKAMNPFAQNKEITELKITQHDANLSPVVLVGMSHQNITDMAELRRIAESYIRNELIRLEGVAEVTLSGEEVTTLTVQTDPYKLNAFQLKIEDIASRIESNNQSISGGRVSELGLQYLVKSSSLFSTEADFENLIVGYKPVQQETSGNSSSETVTDLNKAPVFLKEVATVQVVNARPENIVRINGKRSIGLSIYKEMRFNTVKVVDEVTSRLAVIEDALPGYHFQVISNQGTFIKSAIGEVKSSAILGIVLAVIVLFVFLRRMGTTLIVSLSIPISIVATFNLMFFNGLTLNIMTLGGLALGAGMLVDNAIVVIDTIIVRLEDKEYENGIAIDAKKLSLEIAEQEQSKQKALYEKGGVTMSEMRNTEVKVTNARYDYENAQLNLEKMKVKAPFDGVIVDLPHYTTDIRVEQGKPVVSLMAYDKMYMDINLPESSIRYVKEAQPVYITHYTIPGDTLRGKISELSPAISSETRTYKGKVLVDNNQLKLRPGMFAKADIVVDRADSSIIIPKDVILSNRRRKYVYVVEKNTAKIRNLETGLEDEYNIEIISGLKVNDNLVVKGFETLKEDAKVKIQK